MRKSFLTKKRIYPPPGFFREPILLCSIPEGVRKICWNIPDAPHLYVPIHENDIDRAGWIVGLFEDGRGVDRTGHEPGLADKYPISTAAPEAPIHVKRSLRSAIDLECSEGFGWRVSGPTGSSPSDKKIHRVGVQVIGRAWLGLLSRWAPKAEGSTLLIQGAQSGCARRRRIPVQADISRRGKLATGGAAQRKDIIILRVLGHWKVAVMVLGKMHGRLVQRAQVGRASRGQGRGAHPSPERKSQRSQHGNDGDHHKKLDEGKTAEANIPAMGQTTATVPEGTHGGHNNKNLNQDETKS
jgi:hypothetical protein